MGVSRLESWGNRLRAPALPAERAPTNIAKHIDGRRRAVKQPVIEATAFSGNVESSLPQENARFESSAQILATDQHLQLPDTR